ncbi:uncharacterized protein RJT21DRAFT_118173 [Scheffersomyces amazonensis]|uniref:uncharacterized protein n=1 Tax=Scheffersomyces amazonensis TaxID=1078765 RepID=UPI00315CEEE5
MKASVQSILYCITIYVSAVVASRLNQEVLAVGTQFEGLKDIYVNDLSFLYLHKSLIDIESLSNSENGVSQYLKKYLELAGFTVELQRIHDDYDERYNVYAYLGSTRNTKVLLTSHIDTVPPYIPYNIEGTKIYGRGSCDAKASVAAQVFALLSLIHSGEVKEGDVSLLFVVGEEVSGVGMQQATELNAKWDVAIFGEPTELKLGVGHKGIMVIELQAEGKASHSGYPELGVSASEILIPVLNDLINLKFPVDELLGPNTLNVGKFEGGVAANVVPGYAEALVSVRIATDIKEVEEKVLQVIKDVPNLKYNIRSKSSAQHIDYDIPDFDTIVLAYGTDIPNLSVPVQKRYLYGPGSIHVAHSDHEFVENSDLLQAFKDYQKITKYALQHI